MDRPPIYNPSRSSSTTSSESSLPYATMIPNSSKEKLLPTFKPQSPRHHPKPFAKKGLRTPSRKIALSAFLISLLCLLLLALSALLVFFYLKDLQGGVFQGHEEVCMPCDQVRPNPLSDAHSPLLDLLEVRPSKDVVDTEICCAHTAAQYAALFKLILQRQEEVKRLADVLGYHDDKRVGENGDVLRDPVASALGEHKAISAHLVHKPPSSSTADEPGIQRWKSDAESPMSHVRQGLVFEDNNKITVVTPGLYFVYCQILYNKADKPLTSMLASSYVMRNSLSYPASTGILLKSRHTRFNDDTDRHSSYVGGLFFLHKGDGLFVKVSVPEAVSHDDRASFFGLFKVGN
ncbi:CD40 ligand-like isoform X2 [Littorina saxatilis]|uniref:CD40 ligand-like isoform X2 n=1 Tax=Littorina saxatilis TaxID=31220 RepID=UPI0038B5DAD2